MTKKSLLKCEATEYLKHKDMTPLERQELLDWIRDGNSVNENPWLMADERGHMMDYLTAVRAADELWYEDF